MSSSDLELARALSRLLSEPPSGARAAAAAPSASVPPPDPSRFVRFRGVGAALPARPPAPAGPPAVPVPAAAPAPPEPPAIAPGGFGAGVYTPLLEWACRAASADAAFLMDPHGLVVATVGALEPEEAEAFGARLMVALDQARAMSGDGGPEATVAVEAGEKVLTAFAATASDGIPFTVGLTGPAHVPRPVREALQKALGGG